jgi:hypothetical protein
MWAAWSTSTCPPALTPSKITFTVLGVPDVLVLREQRTPFLLQATRKRRHSWLRFSPRLIKKFLRNCKLWLALDLEEGADEVAAADTTVAEDMDVVMAVEGAVAEAGEEEAVVEEGSKPQKDDGL